MKDKKNAEPIDSILYTTEARESKVRSDQEVAALPPNKEDEIKKFEELLGGEANDTR